MGDAMVMLRLKQQQEESGDFKIDLAPTRAHRPAAPRHTLCSHAHDPAAGGFRFRWCVLFRPLVRVTLHSLPPPTALPLTRPWQVVSWRTGGGDRERGVAFEGQWGLSAAVCGYSPIIMQCAYESVHGLDTPQETLLKLRCFFESLFFPQRVTEILPLSLSLSESCLGQRVSFTSLAAAGPGDVWCLVGPGSWAAS